MPPSTLLCFRIGSPPQEFRNNFSTSVLSYEREKELALTVEFQLQGRIMATPCDLKSCLLCLLRTLVALVPVFACGFSILLKFKALAQQFAALLTLFLYPSLSQAPSTKLLVSGPQKTRPSLCHLQELPTQLFLVIPSSPCLLESTSPAHHAQKNAESKDIIL